MEITRTATAEHFEIKLKGRLDAIWSDHVARALAESVQSGQHVLALDMAEVDFISSAGIRILMIYTKQLKSIHGRLAVIHASENVRNVLELAGLRTLLQVGTGPAAAPLPAAERSSGQFVLSQPGTTAEMYDLDLNATLEVDWPGDSAAWLAGQAPPAACTSVEFSVQTLGLGLALWGMARRLRGSVWASFWPPPAPPSASPPTGHTGRTTCCCRAR